MVGNLSPMKHLSTRMYGGLEDASVVVFCKRRILESHEPTMSQP
jgi:hypothetical protein